MAEIIQSGAPNKFTVGAVGDIYVDSISGRRYELIAIHHSTSMTGPVTEYEWDEIGAGDIPCDAHTHNNKTVLDKLSENTDGNLLFGGNTIQGGGSGEAGADGKDGADGKSAYQIAVDLGFEGDEAAWLESLKGEQGPQGIRGETGPQGEKGEQGETGPQGPQGEKGADGVMTFADLTEEQKESLRGPQGIQGEKGEPGEKGEKGDPGETGSEGPQGIQGEKGEPGEKGDKGDPGEAGPAGADGKDGVTYTPQIGTVTTGETVSASVDVDETAATATFNFTLPIGSGGSSSGEVPDGVTYVSLSESEDVGEVTEIIDADRLGGRLPEYYATADDLAPIKKYQKYVNTELDYGLVTMSADVSGIALDMVIPFDTIRNTNGVVFDVKNNCFHLKANKTYNIESFIRYCSATSFAYYGIYDATNDKWIQNVIGATETTNTGWDVSIPTRTIITTSEDIDIQIKITEVGAITTGVIHSAASYFEVHEINRAITIDPLEHVNSTQGIEDAPVGHIISYMGNNAPAHYLSCDGSTYNISDYPYLAQHLIDEFGSVNYFGGDGETTFAVPDLRGEFLRGTGTALRNTGSGSAVGEHQHGTVVPNFYVMGSKKMAMPVNPYCVNVDKSYTGEMTGSTTGLDNNGTWNTNVAFGVRPTNTSVLYCIKYEPTYFMQNTYLGNEEVVLYEGETKVEFDTPSSSTQDITLSDSVTNYDEIRIFYASYNDNVEKPGKLEQVPLTVSDIKYTDSSTVALNVIWCRPTVSVVSTLYVGFIDNTTLRTFSCVKQIIAGTNTAVLGVRICRIVGYRSSLINS